MKSFILFLKEYWVIILSVAVIAIGIYLYFFIKRKKWKSFSYEHGLHVEKFYFKKDKQNQRRQLTKIKYPSYKKTLDGIVIKNFNYRVLIDEINTNLEQYERFFNCELIEAKLNKERNIILIKSRMLLKVEVNEKAVNFKVICGADDKAKIHHLDFSKGVRVFISGPTGIGKTTFVEALTSQLDLKIDYYILAPRKSFNFADQKYYDTNSVQDLKNFLLEIEAIKFQISQIKSKMRIENIKDELFSDYVAQNNIDFNLKIFILDDSSTYLRSSFYSKADEIKPLIEKISQEFNKILREWRIYRTNLFVIAHSPLVEEIDLSSNNYSHRFYNRVVNQNQSNSITGDSKILMADKLTKGCWYLITDNFSGYLRTVQWLRK